jgi:hypothetical protein
VAWRSLDEAVARGLPWLYRTAQLTLANRARAAAAASTGMGFNAAVAVAHPLVPPSAHDVGEVSLNSY